MTTPNLHNTVNFLDIQPLPLVSGQQVRPRNTFPVSYNPDMNSFDNNSREFQCNIQPQSGIAGDTVTVVFYGHINEPVKLSFNQLLLPTERKDGSGMVSLLAEVPDFFKTRSVNVSVQLYLIFMKKDNSDIPIRQQYIGDFTYKNSRPQPTTSYSNSYSTPMSYSSLANDVSHMPFSYQQQPINTVMTSPFTPSERESGFTETQQSYGSFYRSNFGSLGGINHQQVPEGPYYNSNNSLGLAPYSNSISQAAVSTPRAETQYMSNIPLIHRPNPVPVFESNNDCQNSWSSFNQGSSYSNRVNSHRNISLDCHQTVLHPVARHTDRRSPYRRVSRNLRGYGKAPIDFNSISLDDYNPYPDIINPIQFNVLGSITTMLLNWSDEENSSCRRLVRLSRRIEPYSITCNFESTLENLAHERVAHEHDSMVVSCIGWPGKDTYWITSVDCINLAEFLLGTRFDVDYKNCIRRNLEGFGPTTVSKTKPDSIEFFKLIMGFNHPKPRNIEKDIKVFQWHILPFALKKIIIKYRSEKA
ncbi:hypothetical protein BY458DRAFT_480298 [Sporodiniella umbellata]|nr:hypothetical protein BY458DRAFT_480298 [Sporodiniella umbellata]